MKHADPNSLLVTLPADQMEWLDELVDSGEYGSKEDVVREALELWEQHHAKEAAHLVAWHRHEHEAGLASGLAEDLSPEDLLLQFKAELALRG